MGFGVAAFATKWLAQPDRLRTGGEGGIRTPDRLAPMPHFECGAIDHSATSPGAMTGGLPPSVGRSSRRGWLARQGAAGEKIGPGERRAPDAAQRVALREAVRCRAGAVPRPVFVTVPALPSSVKSAAPRP